MRHTGHLIRTSVSIWLAALTLTLSVAIPILARADLMHEPVAEGAHEPGNCPSGHDHTVCTQVGANLSLATSSHLERVGPALAAMTAPGTVPSVIPTTFREGHRSRAPPLA